VELLKITQYIDLFEKEFKKDIEPPKDYYTLLKRSKRDIVYDLNKINFYGVKPPFSYINKNDHLVVNVKKNNIKTLYLSHLILDTKFGNVPEKSFVNLEETKKFYISIDISENKGIEVIPFIIQYNESGKKNMIRVIHPVQLFEVENDVKKLRLVFKVKGYGNFIIRHIIRRDVDVN